jgi:hypothetical protein
MITNSTRTKVLPGMFPPVGDRVDQWCRRAMFPPRGGTIFPSYACIMRRLVCLLLMTGACFAETRRVQTGRGTDHEWQTWRRNLKDFAARLFRD